MSKATSGDQVSIHYTGKLLDGSVFDSSDGREPLVFTIGAGEVIPGFDQAVEGMEVGESKNVTIPADQAYGPRQEELVLVFPKEQVPPGIEPQLNQHVQLKGPEGQVIVAQVVEVNDEMVKLDANSPLAGETLVFDIELMAIR